MKFNKFNTNQFYYICLVSFTLILLVAVFKYINYLTSWGYIVECFDSNLAIYRDTGSPSTNHTVNIPLTTTFGCKNFCGPGNTCAITGEQCTNDYDCTGCENIPKYKPPKVEPHYKELSQNNEQMDYVYVGAKNNSTPSYYSGGNDLIKIFDNDCSRES